MIILARFFSKSLAIALLTLGLVACDSPESPLGVFELTDTQTVSFADDVKPILDSRCIACHSCYDAPCQLKLTSHAGVDRGGSDTRVYDPERLQEASLSRLHFDALSTEQWRDKNFYSVLRSDNSDRNSQNILPQAHSTLMGMLELGDRSSIAEVKAADLPLNNPSSWQCSANKDQFQEFSEDYPSRGMPYGLPRLEPAAAQTIKDWITQGGVNDTQQSISTDEQRHIDKWEAFLNGSSLKQQLVARYIYEHLFLANLYFRAERGGRYFQLVRSRTAPGQPLDLIATRRPFDDPIVGRPYYRLRLVEETIVAKTHMPFLLDENKHRQWTEWFFERPYTVAQLPSYEIESASNPFKTFADIPAKSRYQFMLSESQFIVGGFIKGPVCKGQSAVNVINEHFWVFFLDPDVQEGDDMMRYLERTSAILDMPAEKEDTLNLLGAWREYETREQEFLSHRKDYLQNNLVQDGQLSANLIWDGEQTNKNAALTVFRHFDHASVRKGLIGQLPKTVWVIDYPLLERIHYLLVAGYDVYGNISHQLLSRVYMDFLRMEGESLFLAFLSDKDRKMLRQHWYRNADERIESFMARMDTNLQQGSIVRGSTHPKDQLVDIFKKRLHTALNQQYSYRSLGDTAMVKAIEQLQMKKHSGLNLLPETSVIEIKSEGAREYFTLIKHVGHLNNSSILFEELNLAERETSVSLVPGFVAPRPNLFFSIHEPQAMDFIAAIGELESEQDFATLLDRYGVSRYQANFWQYYDQINSGFKEADTVESAWLDLTNYQF